ncbi:MAG TPA: MFS transporter [Ktedonosporobacter sp.]|nr:MFS transporter [Ktedonosporobacter sp.]
MQDTSSSLRREEASTATSGWPMLRTVRVLVSILMLQLAFGLVYSWGAVVPYVRQYDHWSPLLTSAVFSAGPLGYATGMIISGRLAEYAPPRRLCWTGAGLMVGGFAITFLFPSSFTFILFYAAIGLGLGGAIAMAGSLAAGITLFPTRVGTIGGALTGSYALAALIEAPLVGALAMTSGWLNALRVVGSGVALMAVVMVLLMPSVPRSRPVQAGRNSISFPQLMGRKAIWIAILLEATATPLGSYAFAAIAAYTHGLRLEPWMAAVAIIAVAAGNALGRIVGGTASDYFGIKSVFLVICGANLVAAILLYRTGGDLVVLLAAFLAGIGFGGPAGVLSRLASASAPDAPHAAFGLLFAGFAFGAFYGPLLGSAVGGTIGWLVLGAIGLMCGLLLLVRVPFTRHRG